MRNVFGWDYPPGAEHDSSAPYNQTDAEDDHDDDPRCVCGTYRSEHQLCGCPEGFQTAESWAAELKTIEEMDDWTFEQWYGDRS